MSNKLQVITFPKFTGAKCNMMPFIQGNPDSIPEDYKSYRDIIRDNFIEKDKIGYLTLHESWVEKNQSQRGYNSKGIQRNVHIEVGRHERVNSWGGGGSSWGGKKNVFLRDDVKVLIANNISGTCRYWNVLEMSNTLDGDLSDYIDRYPESTGILMQAGEVAEISIFTPHECIAQQESGYRQFFRIVGDGVTGREDYFTLNPLLEVK